MSGEQREDAVAGCRSEQDVFRDLCVFPAFKYIFYVPARKKFIVKPINSKRT